MSATKNWLHDYSQALDGAWEALEEAIVKMEALNDQLYDGEGEMKARAPRADVSLLAAKIKELQDQMSTMTSAQEPSRKRPMLPGEIRFDFDRMMCYVS